MLVCNHVTFIDWLIIASACKRPARFVMYHKYFQMPWLGFVFRDAKVIPIAAAREDRDTLDIAFDQIARELEEGEIVCIFPEGKLTKDGGLNPFRAGVEKIIARTPVPVIPMALIGMWGSFFSHKNARPMTRPFRRVWSKVALQIGAPISPEEVTAQRLAEKVADLGGWEMPVPVPPAATPSAAPPAG